MDSLAARAAKMFLYTSRRSRQAASGAYRRARRCNLKSPKVPRACKLKMLRLSKPAQRIEEATILGRLFLSLVSLSFEMAQSKRHSYSHRYVDSLGQLSGLSGLSLFAVVEHGGDRQDYK